MTAPLAVRYRRVALALLLAGAAMLGVAAAVRVVYSGRIFPGVQVDVNHVSAAAPPSAPLDVGGLAADDAATVIAQSAGDLLLDGVTLVDPGTGERWPLEAADVGLALDPRASADAALAEGRRGNPLGLLVAPLRLPLRGAVVPAIRRIDPELTRSALERLAEDVSRPPVNARLERRDGQLLSVEPVLGAALDIDATAAALAAAVAAPGAIEADMEFAATTARVGSLAGVAADFGRITARSVQVVALGERVDEILPGVLDEWFSVEELANSEGDLVPTIVVDRDQVRARVEGYRAAVNRAPRSARFAIDPRTRDAALRRAGEPGVTLDVERSIDRIIEAAYTDNRLAELAAEVRFVGLSSNEAATLDAAVDISRAFVGLAQLPEGHLRNLSLAAEALDGVAVTPAGTFSFLDELGEVTVANGYDLGAMEQSGGLGGGITELATAVYRAALWAGLPVLERHAHPYRIGFLEPPIGLDATVGPPDLDLRIANDSESHLLFHVAIDAERAMAHVDLLAAPAFERQTRLDGPEVTGISAALGVRSLTTDTVPLGERRQVRWAREGATARYEREVSAGGAVRFREAILSTYAATGDLFAVGVAVP